MTPFKDLIGKKYNLLEVIAFLGYKGRSSYWLCKCDCGHYTTVQANNLQNGHTTSCGCRKNRPTHNLSKTQHYRLYYNIKSRCYNEKNPYYYNYGGRGIKMCEEWKNSFVKFNEWLKQVKYKQGLTIERIDVNKDYSPQNCKLATMKEQSNNKRNNRLETYNGETHTVAEWASILNINESTLRNRLTRHSFAEAVNM